MQKSIRICSAIGAAVCVVIGLGVLVHSCTSPLSEETLQTETIPVASIESSTEAESSAETMTETSPPELTVRAKELLAQNPDTIGWITIENTDVDNPIVQCSDNSYYLDHDFQGEPFRAGTVFLDHKAVFGYDEEEQSANLVVYGHNMANNTMFGSLRRYRQDLSYYQSAPIIHLESNYTSYDYVIFGLVITDGGAEATWKYWNMEDLSNRPKFNAYVRTVQEKNMIQTPIDVQYGDKLLTLSTCYSDQKDSRFLVIARRLRPDENVDEIKSALEETAKTE